MQSSPPVQTLFKILIVDEHPPSLAVLAYALASRGYACEAACTAGEALARVAAWQPNVVVYEWDLREGDGRGLARRFRAASPSVTMVISVSAHNEPEDFRDSEQVDGYLIKPFDVEQLERLITAPSYAERSRA